MLSDLPAFPSPFQTRRASRGGGGGGSSSWRAGRPAFSARPSPTVSARPGPGPPSSSPQAPAPNLRRPGSPRRASCPSPQTLACGAPADCPHLSAWGPLPSVVRAQCPLSLSAACRPSQRPAVLGPFHSKAKKQEAIG